MNLKLIIPIAYTLAVFLSTTASWAALSPMEIARLGTTLTPVGAERAANPQGTIPAWAGGLTKPPPGYVEGQHYIDPFADEPILFSITAANMAQYQHYLADGHQALLKTYPKSFKLLIYPTHRTAACPPWVYDAIHRNALTAELTDNGNGVKGAIIGIPFPIPKNGLEIIWNHLLRWRAITVSNVVAQAAPTRSGSYTLVKFADKLDFRYARPDMTTAKLGNVIALFKQAVIAPARLAGGILLVHETLDQNREPRRAWIYNPGQRRVRRAPNVAFDNPGTAADGQRTSDQLDMYNGSPERYYWKLIGKREIYVPYNNYKLQAPELKFKDILQPLHINPELLRYELHRVWVVEATLKPNARHIYKRRTFYVDEDSWQILLVDQYDNRDQLWRVSEGFVMNYYNVPNLWTTLETHTDLQSGRYLAVGLSSEYPPYQFNVDFDPREFMPSALRREGRR